MNDADLNIFQPITIAHAEVMRAEINSGIATLGTYRTRKYRTHGAAATRAASNVKRESSFCLVIKK